jgi:hydroxyacylglutathione hydrolase
MSGRREPVADRKAIRAASLHWNLLNERCGCASYVIASRKTLEAAVFDAPSETEPYDTSLRERGFRLRFVIDTHIHADQVSGARRLVAAHGAELCLHESARTAYPFHALGV